jgi:poly-gamma-glutamate synthesis protein (capsule biosynthesis protein)
VREAGYIPCYINPQAVPVPATSEEEGRATMAYMETITRDANLNAQFEWLDGKVSFLRAAVPA